VESQFGAVFGLAIDLLLLLALRSLRAGEERGDAAAAAAPPPVAPPIATAVPSTR
jgi:hypothetical protein